MLTIRRTQASTLRHATFSKGGYFRTRSVAATIPELFIIISVNSKMTNLLQFNSKMTDLIAVDSEIPIGT